MLEQSDYRTITNKFITIAYTRAHQQILLALVRVQETTSKALKDAHVNQDVHLGVHVTTTARILTCRKCL